MFTMSVYRLVLGMKCTLSLSDFLFLKQQPATAAAAVAAAAAAAANGDDKSGMSSLAKPKQ